MQQSARKYQYAELCQKQFVPLFSRAYWLDAVSVGKDWDVILVSGGAMAYHRCRKWCLNWILMPQQTQTCSLLLDAQVDCVEVSKELATALDTHCRRERIAYCSLQGFWPDAFRSQLAWQGYTVTEQKTYRIAKGTTRDELLQQYSENKRRQLRKAHDLSLDGLTVDQFYTFHSSCLTERGKCISYSGSFAQSMLGTALAHGNALLLGVRNSSGDLLAAVGLVYDEQVCYYLLPTYKEAAKNSGAMAWLTTEAIMWSMEHNLTFDFEGSMVPSIARSYREFGGQPVVYHRAEKFYNPLVKLVFGFKKMLMRS